MNMDKIKLHIKNMVDQNQLRGICPVCSETRTKKWEKVFSITQVSDDSILFHCFHCGVSGVVNFNAQLKVLVKKDLKEKINNFLSRYKITSINQEILEYYIDRGIDEETIRKYVLCAEDKLNGSKHSLILLKNENDETIGFQLRSLDKSVIKTIKLRDLIYSYKNNNNRKFILITEGFVDFLTALRFDNVDVLGLNSASVSQAEMEFLEQLSVDHKFILCFDNDEAGIKATQKIMAQFPESKIIVLDQKDLNDEVRNGGLDNVKIQIEEIIKNEKYKYIESLNNGCDEDQKIFFNNFLKIKQGTLNILTGSPNSGKTVLIFNMINELVKNYQEKILLISLELNKSQMKNLFNKISGGKINYDQIEILNECSGTQLIEKINELCRMEYYSVVIIDNLSAIHFQTESLYLGIREFIQQLNNLKNKYSQSILLVAHPRKLSSLESEVSAYDIADSAQIINLSDFVFSLNRASGNKRVLVCQKSRDLYLYKPFETNIFYLNEETLRFASDEIKEIMSGEVEENDEIENMKKLNGFDDFDELFNI